LDLDSGLRLFAVFTLVTFAFARLVTFCTRLLIYVHFFVTDVLSFRAVLVRFLKRLVSCSLAALFTFFFFFFFLRFVTFVVPHTVVRFHVLHGYAIHFRLYVTFAGLRFSVNFCVMNVIPQLIE